MSRVVAFRCWQVGPREPDLMSTFCLLPLGHKGPCQFTRDHEARVEDTDRDLLCRNTGVDETVQERES